MSAPAAKPLSAPHPVPAGEATLELLRAADLPNHLEAWQKLADNALFPNLSYEPWMVMPVIEAGVDTKNLYFAFIYGPNRELWGFVPLEAQWSCLHLPIRNLALWQHRYCYVTAPLFDAGHAREALGAFWLWFKNNPLRAHILDTNWLLADGPFHHLWIDLSFGRVQLMLNDFPRAMYCTGKDLWAYLGQMVSPKGASDFRRRERRFADMGKLEYTEPRTEDEARKWIEDFLALEASGWKAQDGGKAFANYEPDAQYFRIVTLEAFRRGRTLLLSMELDGKIIAMRHTLLAGNGAYAYRLCYDEAYGKYSPGKILELKTMERLNQIPGIAWMDSCAAPRHALFNRLWYERRLIRRTLYSDGTLSGDSFVSALPLIRWLGKHIRRTKPPEYLQVSTRSDG